MDNEDTKLYKHYCTLCEYKCSRPALWKRHLNSQKHKQCIETNMSYEEIIMNKNKCDICNKQYNTSSGLWYHKQTCKPIETNDTTHIMIDKQIFINLMKDINNIKQQLDNILLQNQY